MSRMHRSPMIAQRSRRKRARLLPARRLRRRVPAEPPLHRRRVRPPLRLPQVLLPPAPLSLQPAAEQPVVARAVVVTELVVAVAVQRQPREKARPSHHPSKAPSRKAKLNDWQL